MYLDPGMGSMIIQVIIAALAVGGSALYVVRDRIKNLWKRKQKRDDDKERKE